MNDSQPPKWKYYGTCFEKPKSTAFSKPITPDNPSSRKLLPFHLPKRDNKSQANNANDRGMLHETHPVALAAQNLTKTDATETAIIGVLTGKDLIIIGVDLHTILTPTSQVMGAIGKTPSSIQRKSASLTHTLKLRIKRTLAM